MDIIDLLYDLANKKYDDLERMKKNAEQFGRHCDWPWNGLVLSGATRGGSQRWENNVKPRYDRELSWCLIDALPTQERYMRLLTIGRFKNKTAKWLNAAYERIVKEGGPPAVRAKISCMNAGSVILFWKSFDDIKDKYARNVMMDVYDPRFRIDYFAIDSRISKLLPMLGYTGSKKYEAQESFLVELAKCVGIEAWELDRLLYGSSSELNDRLKFRAI